ncbi:ERV/ALR sulfhydryl oxidase domain-containing protein [Boeremia exigua]|uniref:ERV/ALR sulfhydryl oxidase domain-containing protein n=1 Tax=Boeremia exigua TaxID=749465 RepID=UPI001E8D88C8|nr:ERV/ALR sulfhydryl oxidase domain-containing protein [Boeremia exigua]KAH6643773.1 ERV/ALR sulfhydryl oxidase domain-containing protein [Boeremia exigua]
MASLPTETPEKKDAEKTLPGGRKIINGIIYDADGKPCRTCNDMSALFALGGKKKRAALPPALPKDCPPDVAQLGRSSWTLLHSITATYPENPPSSLQSETSSFLRTFGKLYPCWVCAEDFQDWMKTNTPRVSSRSEFGQWMCEAHNAVNVKLGKKEFDCTKWEERWRTGWKDGRCDP